MPTQYHYIDFDTTVSGNGKDVDVTVEAVVSSYGSNAEIEGVKVRVRGMSTELALSDKQKRAIYEEIWEHLKE